MESALYGIYALVVFVSEILLVRCAHSSDFWYVNNLCVNTVRQHFPWSILYNLNTNQNQLNMRKLVWGLRLKDSRSLEGIKISFLSFFF